MTMISILSCGCPDQALGIPFEVVSASEKDPNYQAFICENHRLDLRHLYGSPDEQLRDKSCVLCKNGWTCSSVDVDTNIHFGITGAPCDPYSTQRCKRFSNGAVAAHSDYSTLMIDVIRFYRKYEPKTGIVEQVEGFNMATSSDDKTTPLQRQGCLEGGGGRWGLSLAGLLT